MQEVKRQLSVIENQLAARLCIMEGLNLPRTSSVVANSTSYA